jgi:galactokinase/galacturonokinase
MDLDQIIQRTAQHFQESAGRSFETIRHVIAPYRICPLGAHIDHQGGPVLGRTINAYSVLAFSPLDMPEIQLVSANYPEKSSFSLAKPGPVDHSRWDRYARGAVYALSAAYPLRRGLTGFIQGALPDSGLSSSASVGLAYLAALANVNGISLDWTELIELDRRLENSYLGLHNGILDQTTILYGRRDAMLHINTQKRTVTWLEDPPTAADTGFLVFFSGFTRELTATGFNARVIECHQAALQLARMAGLTKPRWLADIPGSVWRSQEDELPDPLRRRARHFFGEVKRVNMGRQAWLEGNMSRFGSLMNESCASSIELYQSGSGPIIRLQEIVSSIDGVLGSRFSGGGYGGCVVALVEKGGIDHVRQAVKARFLDHCPGVAGKYLSFVAKSESGLRLM